MSDKMTCPGCQSHTSGVLSAFCRDEPCPYCGLSADAIGEILTIRSKRANEDVAERAVAAEIRADRAEREADLLRFALAAITTATAEAERLIRDGGTSHD